MVYYFTKWLTNGSTSANAQNPAIWDSVSTNQSYSDSKSLTHESKEKDNEEKKQKDINHVSEWLKNAPQFPEKFITIIIEDNVIILKLIRTF